MAGKTMVETFEKRIPALTKLSAYKVSSVIMQNEGPQFTMIKLPSAVQWSTVIAFAVDDLDDDGMCDIVIAGNFYGMSPYEGRYGTSYGNLLLNSRCYSFESLPPAESGLLVDGEIRGIVKIEKMKSNSSMVFARNNNRLVF